MDSKCESFPVRCVYFHVCPSDWDFVWPSGYALAIKTDDIEEKDLPDGVNEEDDNWDPEPHGYDMLWGEQFQGEARHFRRFLRERMLDDYARWLTGTSVLYMGPQG